MSNQKITDDGFVNPKRLTKYNVETARMWHSAEISNIEFFYKTREAQLNPFHHTGKTATRSFFWSKVPGSKYHRVHSGLAHLMVQRLKDLINTGFKVTETEDDIDSLESLNEILEDNDFRQSLFDKGIVDSTWAGHTAYKLSFDSTISKFPLIETVEPEQIWVEKKRGRIVRYVITFIDDELFNGPDQEEKDYVIEEIYQFDNTGTPTITYKAYGDDKKQEEIKQSKYEDIVLTGLDFLPIFLFNNTTTNTHPNVPFGNSQLHGTYSLLDEIDETLSIGSQAVRFSLPKRFISEALLETNENGDVIGFDDFEIDYIVTKEQLKMDQKEFLDQHTSKLQMDQYDMYKKSLIKNALSLFGLSSITIGDENIAVTATGDTMKEKENISMRTRDGKIKLWKAFLENFFDKLVQFNDYINKTEVGDYNFNVDFNDFEEMRFDELVELYSKAKLAGLVSTKQMVDALNPEMNKANREQLLVVIKTENDQPILEGEIDAENLTIEPEEDVEVNQ